MANEKDVNNAVYTAALNSSRDMKNSLRQYNDYKDAESSNNSVSDLDNTNLYIKGLWKDCSQVDLDDLFKQFGVICQSRVYGDGVGFVRFEQGIFAKKAIEAMNGKRPGKCTDILLVKYAFKKQRNSKRYIRVGDEVKQYEVEMIMNKNTNNVYLRCLPRGFTEAQLTELCNPYGELTCTRLRESGVAFVRFRKSEDAQIAIRELNGKGFENHNEKLLAKLANSDPFQPKIGFKQRPFDEDDGGGDAGNNANSNEHDGHDMSSVAESTNTMTPPIKDGSNQVNNNGVVNSNNQNNNNASARMYHSHMNGMNNMNNNNNQNMNGMNGMNGSVVMNGQRRTPQHYQQHIPPNRVTPSNYMNAPQNNGYNNNNNNNNMQRPSYGGNGHPNYHQNYQGQPPQSQNNNNNNNNNNYHPHMATHPPPHLQQHPHPPHGANPYGNAPNNGNPYGNAPYPYNYAMMNNNGNPNNNNNGYTYVNNGAPQPQTQTQPQLQPSQPQPPQPQAQTQYNGINNNPNYGYSNVYGNGNTSVVNAQPPQSQATYNSNYNGGYYPQASQPIQSVNQSMNQSMNPSMNQSINQQLMTQTVAKINSPNQAVIIKSNTNSVSNQKSIANTNIINAPAYIPSTEITSNIVNANGSNISNVGLSKLKASNNQTNQVNANALLLQQALLLQNMQGGIGGFVTPYNVSSPPGSELSFGHRSGISSIHGIHSMVDSIIAPAMSMNTMQPNVARASEAGKPQTRLQPMNALPSQPGSLNPSKSSNPLNVSKKLANQLHQTILKWYPTKCGKLTGMFLQEHNQERTRKYLNAELKLKKKIDKYADLLNLTVVGGNGPSAASIKK